MRNALLAVVTLLSACAGDEVDMGKLAPCTGAAYDTCTDEHECMSQDCRVVGEVGQMCAIRCDANMPCPSQYGEPVTCNAGGICEPAIVHVCQPS